MILCGNDHDIRGREGRRHFYIDSRKDFGNLLSSQLTDQSVIF